MLDNWKLNGVPLKDLIEKIEFLELTGLETYSHWRPCDPEIPFSFGTVNAHFDIGQQLCCILDLINQYRR